MKPDINVKRLYANANMNQLLDCSFLEGCYRLIHLLEEAKIEEVSKSSFIDFECSHWHWRVIETDACDYHLITAQNKAQDFWRGIVSMITERK